MIKRIKKLVRGAGVVVRAMNGEFIVFVLGLILVTAGAGALWGIGTAAMVGGAVLLGDVVFGRVVGVIAMKLQTSKKAGDQ